jgi:aminopeptidase N
MRSLLLPLFFVFLISCEQSEKLPVLPGVDLSLAEVRKANISNITYALDFNIPLNIDESILGEELISFELMNRSQDLQIDFRESTDKLKTIAVNGRLHPIDHRNEHIVINIDYLQNGVNEIAIEFIAGESSLNRQEEFLYTLFVPDRARTAFPVFDQPNLKAHYELKLEIPAEWNAIANAPIDAVKIENGRKQMAFAKSDLMSTYLFSFVVGDFESVTQELDGRVMTMLHRESDKKKAARNIPEIFKIHADALSWLEEYTGIPYPFQKFDFALIPGFQYGGMEHVGAIQYRANSLMLDEDASQSQLLSRASLISHETAHMWFGDLVTMDWFNDVWTKEVFANFMAAKMVNPSFPEIDHDLNFLLRHYPSAYGVDRASGANPIRQELQNLNEAGQMYGAIIYQKAPIMMRQLEMLIGEEALRSGLREYLQTFANTNATWPDLIKILNERTARDLVQWSEVWVNTSGRPKFEWKTTDDGGGAIVQYDADGDKAWPQVFGATFYKEDEKIEFTVESNQQPYSVKLEEPLDDVDWLLNSKGEGYGLFPVDYALFTAKWASLSDLERGSLLIDAYENLIEPGNADKIGQYDPERYLETLKWIMVREQNPLLIGQVLRQTQTIFWNLLSLEQRDRMAPDLERILFHCLSDIHDDPGIKKQYFNAFQNVVITQNNVNRLYDIWNGSSSVGDVRLSENDLIGLSAQLALKIPEKCDAIISTQLDRIQNPDAKRRYAFIADALSADQEVRDAKFDSFKLEENRAIESWVLSAIGYLHHPLRAEYSTQYIRPSLDLLQEIQITGDIFFPKRWLDQTLSNHNEDEALVIVNAFLSEHQNYNKQLKMKIEQSVDFPRRANAIKKAWDKK